MFIAIAVSSFILDFGWPLFSVVSCDRLSEKNCAKESAKFFPGENGIRTVAHRKRFLFAFL